uniref:Early meiotic induction protein 1 n=1 Tax=Talaromyces marneffei PM1 TaxID=1077442 RepID=A0A093VAM6_TALMA
MGWWWPSSSSSNKNAQSDSLPTQKLDNLQQPSISSQPEPTPSRQLTREEKADAELRDFLKSLESSATPPPTSTSSQRQSSTTTTTPPSPDSTTQQEPPSSIAPDSLYPDTMSCRSAFDYAFFCQSFGGQWVNIYRYGELRSCSEHWENFWLCMKARGINDDNTRKEMIRNHYRKKAVKYKTGPSSEDVWEVRMEPLKDAFQGDFEKMEREMQIAEQQQMQQMHEMPEREASPK